jgi:hypothetical protein
VPVDFSNAKAPPKRPASSGGPAPSSRAKRSVSEPGKTVTEIRNEGLQGIGQVAQGLLLMAGQYADAGAIGTHFPPFATEIANLSDQYETVAKVVDSIIQIGPFTAILATGIPLAMQLLANHRIIDVSNALGSNVVDPQTLTAQMKAGVLRMQAEAMRDQQQAMNEAQKAAEEYRTLIMEAEGQKVPA